MVMNIVLAVAVLGIMGLLFGLLLAYASKIFHVEVDERITKISDVLPGANCGGCGFPGCGGLANAIVAGTAPVNGCPVGGADCTSAIAEIMGVNAGGAMKYVATVNCRGGENAVKKFKYVGLEDCAAAMRVAGGPLACTYGCIGLGSCKKVCPFDAIEMKNGIAYILADKCTSCTKCVAECPKNIISIRPYNQDVCVSCASKARGPALTKSCTIGCIGCKLCVKACPDGAIEVVDNLAVIDYDKCSNCGACAEKCPRKLITNAKLQTSESIAD